jgi:1-acyl-sn-glycerol-3-phosphate acyltransferase
MACPTGAALVLVLAFVLTAPFLFCAIKHSGNRKPTMNANTNFLIGSLFYFLYKSWVKITIYTLNIMLG